MDICFQFTLVRFFFFFFSSRRRHTRSLCDWSSDVCSSDLGGRVRHGGLLQHDLGQPHSVGVRAASLRLVGGADAPGQVADVTVVPSKDSLAQAFDGWRLNAAHAFVYTGPMPRKLPSAAEAAAILAARRT